MTRAWMAALWAVLGAILTVPADAQDGDRAPCLSQCKEQLERCVEQAGDDGEKKQACANEALECMKGCGVGS